ncbi:MAG: LptE family protein [candidate division WOR-3 bacterium]|nr:MAG: LptE family protein [candidate division WOR-3 bacterium]
MKKGYLNMTRMSLFKTWVGIVGLCFVFSWWMSCCGYSTRSLLPAHLQTVHISLFTNKTLKAGLDELATNQVIRAFGSGSNLRITDKQNADLVIEGDVSGFSKTPYTYTSDQNVIDYKIAITFKVRCVDVARNDIFWEGAVSEWATYAADADEDGAIDEAMKKTAELLVVTILTNW